MGLLKKRDKSLELTAPKTYELYGVTIRKLPVGKYVEYLKKSEDLPYILLSKVFPDVQDFSQLLDQLLSLDRTAMLKVLGKLLTTAPEQLCLLLSDLLDIPKERLIDPNCEDALALDELMEIILKFVEVNNYDDFFGSVRRLRKLTAPTTKNAENTGSNGGSPSHSQ